MLNVMHVHVRAVNVHDNGNGTFTLAIPTRPLSNEEECVLDNLFRYTKDEVDTLLAKNTLIANVISDDEAYHGELPWTQKDQDAALETMKHARKK